MSEIKTLQEKWIDAYRKTAEEYRLGVHDCQRCVKCDVAGKDQTGHRCDRCPEMAWHKGNDDVWFWSPPPCLERPPDINAGWSDRYMADRYCGPLAANYNQAVGDFLADITPQEFEDMMARGHFLAIRQIGFIICSKPIDELK